MNIYRQAEKCSQNGNSIKKIAMKFKIIHSTLYLSVALMLLFLLCAGISFCANAQTDNWYRFEDHKKNLSGYKDASGGLKVPAKFGGLTRANIFRSVVAVNESSTNSSYYLLRSGKKIGVDSLYVWDMTYDCEQEGKIRFHDSHIDKVGFFGKDGKVQIPATYNDAGPFYNGLALVIHHGKRTCADGTPFDPKSPCEHWGWNGVTALIDTNGRIVADSLDFMQIAHLNWYSLNLSSTPSTRPESVSFKAVQGGYYSFTSYEKEFKQWFYGQYLKNPDLSLRIHSFRQLSVEGLFAETLRKFFKKDAFLKQYRHLVSKRMNAIKKRQVEIALISEDLNPFIYDQADFKSFYTDCGDANSGKYPVFDVVTSHYKKDKQIGYQEHFSFLRTGSGYQLIGIVIGPGLDRN